MNEMKLQKEIKTRHSVDWGLPVDLFSKKEYVSYAQTAIRIQ
jgi:hypothetical protein